LSIRLADRRRRVVRLGSIASEEPPRPDHFLDLALSLGGDCTEQIE
jgi:hypothetical protein